MSKGSKPDWEPTLFRHPETHEAVKLYWVEVEERRTWTMWVLGHDEEAVLEDARELSHDSLDYESEEDAWSIRYAQLPSPKEVVWTGGDQGKDVYLSDLEYPRADELPYMGELPGQESLFGEATE